MRRTVDVRFKVLRNGAEYSELFPIEGAKPTLRMDDGGAIKTSLSGEFAPNSEVDWLTDEIQPVLLLNGQEHTLGVYIPTTADEAEDEGSASVNVEAYDRGWRVQDQKSESRVYFAAGTGYITAIKQLLTAAGVGLIQAEDSTAYLAEAREDWDIGTSYLTIVNELLGEINYKPLWFNASGTAVLEQRRRPDVNSIQHTLDSNNIESLLLPQFGRSLDVFTAPNVFICVCNNPDKSGQMIATAVNENVMSPLSVSRRGRRIVKKVTLNNIADQNALQANADALRDESLGIHETIEVTTALLPGWGVDDVTALHYDDYVGVCLEKSWEMELVTGGSMRHRLERVIYDVG